MQLPEMHGTGGINKLSSKKKVKQLLIKEKK